MSLLLLLSLLRYREMTSELIRFNHLSCHSSSTALGTRAMIELTRFLKRQKKGKLKGKSYRWKPSECIYFFNRQQHDQCLLVSSLNSAKIKGAGTLMMTHGKSRSISYFPFNVSRVHLISGLWSFVHSNVGLFLLISHWLCLKNEVRKIHL